MQYRFAVNFGILGILQHRRIHEYLELTICKFFVKKRSNPNPWNPESDLNKSNILSIKEIKCYKPGF